MPPSGSRRRPADTGRRSPAERAPVPSRPIEPRPGTTTLVLGCGALGRELVELVDRNGMTHMDVRCLPAVWHNRPELIAPAIDAKLTEAAGKYEQMFVAYADCGTGGALDEVLARHGVERLPGAHCYAFYAGLEAFSQIADEEPASFYLTDFLARSFDSLVIAGLGLDKHPELLPVYFGSYARVVYLSQHDDPVLMAAAEHAAERLGLPLVHRRTGYGELGASMVRWGAAPTELPPL